ncbi:MAG TPA: PTS system mannose/fructose/sorbose family transporter subunit IID [Syntrophales bacterium]|jgi:PTS system mannose-specific IID component|nr:PTS system mannose/fructose/sorbose family transporter subunit IID [Syntrophales bacterium]HPX55072.1 PTS system mannose/fructose/sorbose family transporter subunit IID [Syntrophales bacterium]HQA82265.1 PTS system mannose/fructose/sorbose family transporter subunit IID [Syntrophales bacterium]
MIQNMLMNIFFRSLFIQSSLNYPRMQNLGFCYAVIPLLKHLKLTRLKKAEFLKRHLQLFNTHPYLSGAIIASVVREELRCEGGEMEPVVRLKNTFMAPYAALGDPLFSGALKPLCSTVSVLLAFMGFLFTPLVFLLLFNPLHLWIRIKSFLKGYREGNAAFSYISALNLPRLTGMVRLIGLVAAGFLAAFVLFSYGNEWEAKSSDHIVFSAAGLLFILGCHALIKAGISQTFLLYSSVGLILFVSWILC